MTLPFTAPAIPPGTIAVCWGCGSITLIHNGRCKVCTPTEAVPQSACERIARDAMADEIADVLYADIEGES